MISVRVLLVHVADTVSLQVKSLPTLQTLMQCRHLLSVQSINSRRRRNFHQPLKAPVCLAHQYTLG